MKVQTKPAWTRVCFSVLKDGLYQLLVFGAPAGELQLSVSHLRRVEVPGLPVGRKRRKSLNSLLLQPTARKLVHP